ncbi:unnamed protein product [Paramecium octaurelia]|uniref:Uncharacterized protein n=1 Tax=Paramecium octaurelia TaxID=43137 RepID=A0A8S1UE30_PAROT|nr:unnamed protein product [Paramecium octaurelia]
MILKIKINMNILKQKQEAQICALDTICQTHQLELIAVDLDLSDKAQIKFYCGKCLVEKINNNNLTTIEQSKERILQAKAKQQENNIKENQARLTYYKNILDQILDFKRSVDDTLEKIYKQIQQFIFPIQKEKQELQDYEQQLNYFEDIKQLSQLYSQECQKSQKLVEDNNFIDSIQSQLELLFNNSEYFQMLDTIKNTKGIIKDIKENNAIELIPLLIIKNDQKTLSLNRICSNHKKEIIMIDMDSQNKKIEDRFVCVHCISENPQIKYQPIENVNKLWNDYRVESEKIQEKYKIESRIKKSELFTQIAKMRKDHNKKLNDITEKLITEQFLVSDKEKNPNQIKNISIQTLNDEQLLRDLAQLIQKEKENVSQIQIITNLKSKESNFKNEIEFHLESLKQNGLQDIQQSLDILKDNSIEKTLIIKFSGILEQIKTYRQNEVNQKNEDNFIKEFQEFIESSKKCESQLNLFDEILTIYQQHIQKIQQIQQNVQIKQQDQKNNSEQVNTQYLNISNILNDYVNSFHNSTNQLKKYCNIQQLENDLTKLTESSRNLEFEKNNSINQMQQAFDQKLKEINGKLDLMEKEYKNAKKQSDLAHEENIHLKNLHKMEIKQLEDQCMQQPKYQQKINQNRNLANN